jgi:hypothetical protein
LYSRSAQTTTSSSDNSLTSYWDLIRAVFIFIRSNSRSLLASAAVGLLLALLVAHFTPLQYRASVMVAAQEGLSSRSNLGSLGDIAGLTGDLAGGLPFQPFERFTQTIANDTAADAVAKQDWVLPTFFPDQWDAHSNSWHPSRGIFSIARTGIGILFGLPQWHPPGAHDLRLKLDSNIGVEKFGRNPAYTISFLWKDPSVAARFLNLLLNTNDAIIQRDAQARLSSMIAYLEQRLKTEAEVNRRNTLNQLLLEQERSLMAAEAHGPYAAKIIDRMSIVPVATKKIEFGLATFLLISTLTFAGFNLKKISHRIGSDPSTSAPE